MTTTETPETQCEAFGKACESLLAQIRPESRPGQTHQKVVSGALYAAVQEIIAAYQIKDHELAHELLGVKSLICGDRMPDKPFWETKGDPSLYRELDAMEYAAAMALDKIPRGLMVLSTQGLHAKGNPVGSTDSPTLQLIAAAYKEYESRAE